MPLNHTSQAAYPEKSHEPMLFISTHFNKIDVTYLCAASSPDQKLKKKIQISVDSF